MNTRPNWDRPEDNDIHRKKTDSSRTINYRDPGGWGWTSVNRRARVGPHVMYTPLPSAPLIAPTIYYYPALPFRNIKELLIIHDQERI